VKMLLVIYDVDFDEDVMQMLDNLPLAGYTKWDRVLGKGKRSEQKLDDAVWPGFNNAVVIVADDEIENDVLSALNGLFDRLGSKGLAVFELPVMRVI